MQHLSSSSPPQYSTLRGLMLHWLSRWASRLWRSCCYPFQFLPWRDSRPKAWPKVLNEPARDFPSSRSEAICQGIIVLPKEEQPLDGLALDEPLADLDLDLEDALLLSGEGSVERIADAPFFVPGALEPEETLRSPVFLWGSRKSKRRVTSTAAEPPFDWVMENRLAIGALPRKEWGRDLENQGIHTIISLCDEAEGKLPQAIAEQFRCVRVPLPDSRHRRALTVEELGDAVDLIHWHLQKQQPVYLHCLAGIERSPLVAIAYLARYCSMDLLDAVSWLSHVHGRSRPISARLQVVREYLQRC